MSEPLLRHVETEGHRIAVLSQNEDRGGTPLVLIHGVCLSANIWPHMLPESLRHRPWHALGLPAHPPSEPPPDFTRRSMRTTLFGQGLARVLDEILGDASYDVLGHSTGGYAALALAAAAPQRVRSVCAVSAFAQGDWAGTIGLLQTVAALKGLGRPGFAGGLSMLRSSALAARLLTLSTTTRPRASHRWAPLGPMLNAALADLRQADRAALRHFFAQIKQHDIRPQLDAIQAPVLLVHGTGDPIVPFSQARLIKRLVANAQLEQLTGIGHLPFAEATAQYEQIIQDWYGRFPS